MKILTMTREWCSSPEAAARLRAVTSWTDKTSN